MMVVDWPSLNALAWLRLPCCGMEHPTRVEDFVSDDCVIAAPIAPHPQPIEFPDKNEGFFIGWVAGEQTALEVPVVATQQTEEPMPTWTIRAIGPSEETQRRNYVRHDYDTDVLLYLIERGAPVKAKTLDISEGGFRCELDKWALDPGGRIFSLELPFANKTLQLKGQVAWWGNVDNDGNRTAGIRFLNADQPTADMIRRYIFAAQLEERRRRYI